MKAPSWVEVIHDHDTALNLTLSDFETSGVSHMRLIALRRDKEAPPALVPPDSIDLVRSCECFEDWLSLHTAAEEIVTNRLYSAIVGVILGHSVTLLPNSYFKNRAVWEVLAGSEGGCNGESTCDSNDDTRSSYLLERQRKGVTPAPDKRGHASARQKGSRQRQTKGSRQRQTKGSRQRQTKGVTPAPDKRGYPAPDTRGYASARHRVRTYFGVWSLYEAKGCRGKENTASLGPGHGVMLGCRLG